MLVTMSDVTQVLQAIESGDPQAAQQLLPLVYDELRKLARAKLRHEQPGQTLEATALVHEAYLRLVKPVASSQEPVASYMSNVSATGDCSLATRNDKSICFSNAATIYSAVTADADCWRD